MKKNLILIFIACITLMGCNSNYEILQSQGSVILTADSSIKVVGETITFTVKDNEGNDLTEEAVFYVDGEMMGDNTFTSDVVGNFEVKASYLNIESEPLIVNFNDGSGINFRKRVLIEDYTGTWCGWCPRVAYGIELVHQQTNDAVAVAIHRPSSNPSSPVYDPYNYDTSELENSLGGSGGYPKSYLNRMTQWEYPEPNNLNQVIALTQGENPKLGLAMKSSQDGNNLTIDINVMFGKDFGNNMKLVVYILENGLIYKQHNYTTYYDGIDILENFEHNHVLRSCITPLMGEDIPSSQTTIFNTYTKTFNVTIPSSVENTNNIEFVAFVIDEAGNAINVRSSHPGEEQEFEML
ncbi:Omp28-related outer membrane protein [Flavobacterium salilacus subsp. salilacus]|uniref:Omp28-related outer membrane protein n=1 Tax=Flavobacterium TaxID=237 RepID=UPI001074E8EC|nr:MULTISPECIES: Omp28-related outer membrane protein [Flavobacterium]KAF2520145.1 Omp28-related outer membrane protein [Flavobacterium salilacus subsp. salilacus]MBE1613938.1 Omp28-related outer membrane protein [Flavobacterium sp. SaA2.13]